MKGPPGGTTTTISWEGGAGGGMTGPPGGPTTTISWEGGAGGGMTGQPGGPTTTISWEGGAGEGMKGPPGGTTTAISWEGGAGGGEPAVAAAVYSHACASFSTTSSAVTPWMEMIFSRDLPPMARDTAAFLTPSSEERYSHTAALASPSRAGALMLMSTCRVRACVREGGGGRGRRE